MPSLLEETEKGANGRMSKARSHSFSGHERNSFFWNSGGKRFDNLSSVSGLDHIADGRAMAFFDYDRDGWRDIVLVNANTPQLVLYHNEFGKVLQKPVRILAVRLRGGAIAAEPSKDWSNRDGYGAVVTLETANGLRQSREHRCGEGFAAQNSSTILFGLGGEETVKEITVQWPSGKRQTLKNVPHGSEVECWERPSAASGGKGFVVRKYFPK